MKHAPILTARDIMARHVVTLRPEMSIMDAIEIMLRKRISGAPVIDDDHRILGMLSEYDLLRVLASGEYSAEEYEEHNQVGVWMSKDPETIGPDVDIYRLAHLLLERGVRRLPVIEGGKVVGQVSRRDVLRGIERMRDERLNLPRPESPTRTQPGLYLSATDVDGSVIVNRIKRGG